MYQYPIAMSNDLIRKLVLADESRGTIMSVMENRIRLMLISLIDYNDDNFDWHEITVSEFKNFWGLNSWGGIQQKMLSDAIDNLKINKYYIDGRIIKWLDDESEIILGRMKLKLNDSLRQYLLALKRNFTRFNIESVIKLNSKYSFRIYEILNSVKNMGGYRITLPKAYEIFSDNLYNTRSELEHHILIPSIDEINTKTDINISYEFKRSFGENEMLYLIVYNYDDYIENKNKEISYFTVLGGSTNKNIRKISSKNNIKSEITKSKSIVCDLEDCEPVSYVDILKSNEMSDMVDFDDDYIF